MPWRNAAPNAAAEKHDQKAHVPSHALRAKKNRPAADRIPTAMLRGRSHQPLRAVSGDPIPIAAKLVAVQNPVNRTIAGRTGPSTFAEYSAAFGHASFVFKGGETPHQARG